MTIGRQTGARQLVLAFACALAGLAVALPASADAAQTLYVSTPLTAGVRAFDINPTTGALTAVVGSPYLATTGGRHLLVEPSGRHLYLQASGGVHVYDIDAATGVLTQTSGSPFGSGNAEGMAIDPQGRWLFMTFPGSGQLHSYVIDPATGALSFVTTVPTGTYPTGVAVDETGEHVYVASQLANSVSAYDINQSTGAPTPMSSSPFAGDGFGVDLTLDPASEHLYMTRTSPGPDSVGVFDLDPSTGAPSLASSEPSGQYAQGVSVTPAGDRLYNANRNSNVVTGYDIVPTTGALAPIGDPTVATGLQPIGLAIIPTGSRLYVANSSDGTVSAYGINSSSGALTELNDSPFAVASSTQNVAITPAQPPVASFSASAAASGAASNFDASASTDDGSIARYDWDFGDGQNASNAGPVVSHVYANPGSYTVTLTLTDDQGCSTTFVWGGSTAYCNGSSVASATRAVSVSTGGGSSNPGAGNPSSPAALALTKLAAKPSRFRVGRGASPARISKTKKKKKKRRSGGTTIAFRLSEAASVRLDFNRLKPGKRRGKRCVASKRRPKKKSKRCTRSIASGSVRLSGRTGANKFWLSGRIGKRALKRGRYQLSAVARSGTRASSKASTRVAVKKKKKKAKRRA